MNIVHHYPPELMALLIDAIPHLLKSKKDVLVFFRGAGVANSFTDDLAHQLRRDANGISKFEIVRQVLTRLNDKGEVTLRERREILKRVVEWEDFSTCWEDKQMAAKGYVADIKKLVNVKDSFTRINQEREQERQQRAATKQAELDRLQKLKDDLAKIKTDLFALFGQTDRQKRGKALEGVLNRLFSASGISIREAFTLKGQAGEGIVEQIDGVIELDNHVYLVEMKWWTEPLGKGNVSEHLVNVYHRGQSRGILISQSGYTEPAVTVCRDALQRSVFVLCKLEEIVRLLERGEPIIELLREKIRAAIADRNPLHEPARR